MKKGFILVDRHYNKKSTLALQIEFSNHKNLMIDYSLEIPSITLNTWYVFRTVWSWLHDFQRRWNETWLRFGIYCIICILRANKSKHDTGTGCIFLCSLVFSIHFYYLLHDEPIIYNKNCVLFMLVYILLMHWSHIQVGHGSYQCHHFDDM